MNKSLLICICTIIASTSYARDFGSTTFVKPAPGASAIDTYFTVSDGGYYMCSLTFSLSQAMAKLPRDPKPEEIEQSDYTSCISEWSSALTKTHTKAQSFLKKPAQRAALKEHFILSLNNLKGISPLASERVIDYERRQNEGKRALSLQRTRFDAE